jgi:hypothetical protein
LRNAEVLGSKATDECKAALLHFKLVPCLATVAPSNHYELQAESHIHVHCRVCDCHAGVS